MSAGVSLFLSAFLGFVSALTVEWIVKCCNEKSNAKKLAKELKSELQSIEDTLTKLESGAGYISPFRVSVWNLAIQTGTILGLNKKKYYQNLIRTYNQVEEANRIETECFRFIIVADGGSLNSSSKERIFKVQNTTRNDLKTVIQMTLQLWEV